MLLALLQNTIANFESEKWKLSWDEIGWWAACGCGYQLPGVRVRVGGCADVCHVGGLTDKIHVLCFRCLRKQPLSRDFILIHMQIFFFFVEKIHMQFNRPCKNKIKRNHVIYQTLQNYGSKKEKKKRNTIRHINGVSLIKSEKYIVFSYWKKKKWVIFLAEKYVPHFFLHGL